MKQMTKRILVYLLGIVFLLAACAPAPAPTQDPALVQQLKELSAGLTSAAQTAQVQDQQLNEQFAALTAAVQTSQAIAMQASTPSPTASLVPTQTLDPAQLAYQQTVAARYTAQISRTQTAQSQSQSTQPAGQPQANQTQEQEMETGTPAPVEALTPFLSSGSEEFQPCTYTITNSLSTPRTLIVNRKESLNLNPDKNNQIIIIHPVNLRTAPVLDRRVIMTLPRDPTYNPDVTPVTNATPNANSVIYTIIGGPAYTDLSSDDASASEDQETYIPYSVAGRKYKWWQIESPDKKTTGWIVEASACGLYNFIEPVNQ